MVERKGIGIKKFGLTPEALKLISEVFRQHQEVRTVKIFGSRAIGCFEDYSDVDLALWGDLDINLIGQISHELDELPLPFTFDIKDYETINHIPLKEHIDEFGKILYESNDN